MIQKVTEIFEKVRAATGLVGGAAVLIRNGKAETCYFGYSDREAGLPISEKTYFDIASCTKSFTAMTAALAVDKGWFDWDTPVKRYLPEFGVADPELSEKITVRDLLSHRTGLPRHDFIDNLQIPDRDEVCGRYRFLAATEPYRQAYQYCNQMYVYFGYVLEHITGRSYEEWLMEDLAKGAGLGIRVRSVPGCMEGLEHAKPYRTNGKEACRVQYSLCPSEAPDGSVRARIGDLEKWVRLMSTGARELISDTQYQQLLKKNIQTGPVPEGKEPAFYTMGWRTTRRGGKQLYHHSGDMKGFNAMMGFLPGEDSGFAVVVNTNGTRAHEMVSEYLMDLLCGTQLADTDSAIAAWQQDRVQYDDRRQRMEALPFAEGVAAGVYEHPGYGLCTVTVEDGKAFLQYGVMRYQLRQGDGELTGYWKSPLVAEDYDAITVRKDGDGLLLNAGENSLWLPFKKVN
ncbi:MAG: serine hydrolase [Clostridia bacterium]|nr:serine hydrolase [Clostridia bacterium]